MSSFIVICHTKYLIGWQFTCVSMGLAFGVVRPYDIGTNGPFSQLLLYNLCTIGVILPYESGAVCWVCLGVNAQNPLSGQSRNTLSNPSWHITFQSVISPWVFIQSTSNLGTMILVYWEGVLWRFKEFTVILPDLFTIFWITILWINVKFWWAISPRVFILWTPNIGTMILRHWGLLRLL